MNSALEAIAHHIKRTRIAAGLRQVDLADRAGVSERTIQNLESGRSTQWSNLVEVLRILGLWDDVLRAVEPTQVPTPIDELENGRRPERQRVRTELANTEWAWGDEQ